MRLAETTLLGGDDPGSGDTTRASERRQRRRFHIAMLAALQLTALHWGLVGYALGSRIFNLELWSSVVVSLVCSWIALQIELMVMLTPARLASVASRVTIAFLAASLGAFGADIVVFGNEARAEFRMTRLAQIAAQQQPLIARKEQDAEIAKADYERAEAAQNAEAACKGSPRCGTGGIWRALAKQTDQKRAEYDHARAELREAVVKASMEAPQRAQQAMDDAGILDLAEALSDYAATRPAARWVWVAFFLFLLVVELSPLSIRLGFGQLARDRRDVMLGRISRLRDERFFEALRRSSGCDGSSWRSGPGRSA